MYHGSYIGWFDLVSAISSHNRAGSDRSHANKAIRHAKFSVNGVIYLGQAAVCVKPAELRRAPFDD